MTKLKLTRKTNWETEFASFIADRRDTGHSYKGFDCAHFSGDSVEAITGQDPIPEFRDVYTDEKGARKALRDLGKGTLLKTIDSKFKRQPPARAQRGDLVWWNKIVGVADRSFAWFVSEDGLIRIPRAQWEKAWKVGRE